MKKPTLKQSAPVFIILLGIIIFVLLEVTQPSTAVVPYVERSWRVQTLIAKLQTLSPSLSLYGKIESPAMVSAAAVNKSRVTAIYVREGTPIQAGQLLLSLDKRDFKPRLIQAKARVAELNALIRSELTRHKVDKSALIHEQSILQLEQSAVERAEVLKNKKLTSTATLEQAQAQLKRQYLAFSQRQFSLADHTARLLQLKARLAHAEADVELAQLALERSQIIAPFTGFVERLLVSTGDQVKDNQKLLSFYSTEQLEVRAKIPASFQHEIQLALANKQLLTATAYYAGIPLILSLNRLSGIADTRGIDALFNITSGYEKVRPGSSISLSLKRPSKDNVMRLPYSAIYDNQRIYRIVNSRLEGLNVQLAGNYLAVDKSEKILVLSPQLQSGDEILVTHLPNAINGLKVETYQQSL